jgi:hypothetical protein
MSGAEGGDRGSTAREREGGAGQQIKSREYVARVVTGNLDPDSPLPRVTRDDVQWGPDKAAALKVFDEASQEAQSDYWIKRAEAEKGPGGRFTREEKIQRVNKEWKDHTRAWYDSYAKGPGRGGEERLLNRDDYGEYRFLQALGVDLKDFDIESFREAHLNREVNEGRDIFAFVDFITTVYDPQDEEQKRKVLKPRNLRAIQEIGRLFDEDTQYRLRSLVVWAYTDPQAYADEVNKTRGRVRYSERGELHQLASLASKSSRRPTEAEREPDLDTQISSTVSGEATPLVEGVEQPTKQKRVINEHSPMSIGDLSDISTDLALGEAIRDSDAHSARVAIQHDLMEGEDEYAVAKDIEIRLRALEEMYGVKLQIRPRATRRDDRRREWVYEVGISSKDAEALREKLKKMVEERITEKTDEMDLEHIQKEIFKSEEEWTEEELIQLSKSAAETLKKKKEAGKGKVKTNLAETLEAERHEGKNEIIQDGRVVVIPGMDREVILVNGLQGDGVSLEQILKQTDFIRRVVEAPENEKPILKIGGNTINMGHESIATVGKLLKLYSLEVGDIKLSDYIVLERSEDDQVKKTTRREGSYITEKMFERYGNPADLNVDMVIRKMGKKQLLDKNQGLVNSAVRELLALAMEKEDKKTFIDESVKTLAGLNEAERNTLAMELQRALREASRELGSKLSVVDALEEAVREMPEIMVAEAGVGTISRYTKDETKTLTDIAHMSDEEARDVLIDASTATEEDLLKFAKQIGVEVVITPMTVKAKSENLSGKKVLRFRSTGGKTFKEGKTNKVGDWRNRASAFSGGEHTPVFMRFNLNQRVTEATPDLFHKIDYSSLQQVA